MGQKGGRRDAEVRRPVTVQGRESRRLVRRRRKENSPDAQNVSRQGLLDANCDQPRPNRQLPGVSVPSRLSNG